MSTQLKSAETRERLTTERVVNAPVEDVWNLWTTKEGIESWWGPEGFKVTVTSLDLRPGGRLDYVMAAATDEMRAFMKGAGMPAETKTSLVYSAINPPHEIEYTDRVDFVPGVEPYETQTKLQLIEVEEGTRIVLSFEAMHDQLWTDRKLSGWESELGKLAALVQKAA